MGYPITWDSARRLSKSLAREKYQPPQRHRDTPPVDHSSGNAVYLFSVSQTGPQGGWGGTFDSVTSQFTDITQTQLGKSGSQVSLVNVAGTGTDHRLRFSSAAIWLAEISWSGNLSTAGTLLHPAYLWEARHTIANESSIAGSIRGGAALPAHQDTWIGGQFSAAFDSVAGTDYRFNVFGFAELHNIHTYTNPLQANVLNFEATLTLTRLS